MSLVQIPYLDVLEQGNVHLVPHSVPGDIGPPWLATYQAEVDSCFISVPLQCHGALIGALELSTKRPNGFDAEHIATLRQVADQLAIGIQEAVLFEQMQTARERLAILSKRLIEVQEQERRHLARELHDEIGQTLTGLKLMLETNGFGQGLLAQPVLKRATALVAELIRRVRTLSLELRPGMLDDLGLLPALLWHVERYTAQTGVHVTLSHNGLEQRLPPEVETTGYRIVQEALTNVARYAQVREAAVRLDADREMLRIEIRDHGVGFDARSTVTGYVSSGITGMRERALLLAGHFTIDATPGGGTWVRAALPLNQLTSLKGSDADDNHHTGG